MFNWVAIVIIQGCNIHGIFQTFCSPAMLLIMVYLNGLWLYLFLYSFYFLVQFMAKDLNLQEVMLLYNSGIALPTFYYRSSKSEQPTCDKGFTFETSTTASSH